MRRLRDLVRKWIRRHGARQLAAPVTLGLVIFLIASTAYAVGGGHGGGQPHVNWFAWDDHAPPVGWFILNFLLFVWLLKIAVSKPMVRTFAERRETIKNSIDQASAAHANAKEQYEENSNKLANASGEAAALIAKGKADGGLERDQVVTNANRYGKRLLTDSKTIVDNELMRARRRLQGDAARQALVAAEKLLTESMTAEDRTRLLEDAIGQLETGAMAPAGGA